MKYHIDSQIALREHPQGPLVPVLKGFADQFRERQYARRSLATKTPSQRRSTLRQRSPKQLLIMENQSGSNQTTVCWRSSEICREAAELCSAVHVQPIIILCPLRQIF